MKKFYIKQYKQEHKYLYLANIISFFLGIIPFLIFIFCLDFEDKFLAFIFLSPCILIICISLIARKTFSKYQKMTTVITCVLNTLIIVILQCFIALYFVFIFFIYLSDKLYVNPKDYNKALKKINLEENVTHFPKKIPEGASDVELYKTSNSIFGSETICLKFKTNNKYIENELKKYKFITKDIPPNYKYKYGYISNNSTINIDGFTFYIIGHREIVDDTQKNHYYQYHYGIGINKKENMIIYYYTYPD